MKAISDVDIDIRKTDILDAAEGSCRQLVVKVVN